MASLRLAPWQCKSSSAPCSRCGNDERDWDRLAALVLCTECQESLVLGRAAPLRLRTGSKPCAACLSPGTISFLTFPLHSRVPVEMNLCGPHLRSLLSRKLAAPAFNRLRRRLSEVGIDVQRVFLLHRAFYDTHGRALQPAPELE